MDLALNMHVFLCVFAYLGWIHEMLYSCITPIPILTWKKISPLVRRSVRNTWNRRTDLGARLSNQVYLGELMYLRRIY